MDSLILIAFGWLLNELSHRFRSSAQRRSVVGRVLAELLEIRLYIKSISAVVSDFQGTFPVATPSATLDVLNSLNEIVPADPDLRDRYNTALTELASTHPVLAYKLRRKDQISAFLNRLRSIQSPRQSEIDVLVRMHEWLRSEITESVEEAIRQVAWAHGIRTWYSTRRILRRKVELPTGPFELVHKSEQKPNA